jgi:hypothetical protein
VDSGENGEAALPIPVAAGENGLFAPQQLLVNTPAFPLVAYALVRKATYFSRNLESCINCGADPLVRAGPPGPALCQGDHSLPTAKGRRGRRPRTRGSAPQFMQMFGSAKTKWHWDRILRADWQSAQAGAGYPTRAQVGNLTDSRFGTEFANTSAREVHSMKLLTNSGLAVLAGLAFRSPM